MIIEKEKPKSGQEQETVGGRVREEGERILAEGDRGRRNPPAREGMAVEWIVMTGMLFKTKL